MPLRLNNPIMHEGNTYDQATLTVSISSRIRPDGQLDGSIAARILPIFQGADGKWHEAPREKQIPVYVGSLSTAPADVQQLVASLLGVAQQYLDAHGI